jgi:hypothetical protein
MKEELLRLGRECRRLKKYLKELIYASEECIKALDRTVKLPAGYERGKIIARICGYLEMAKDQARYFGLGIDFRSDIRRKPRA